MARQKRAAGTLAIVLHAHLPLVKHPEHPCSLEEAWLFEMLIECYLPLLDVLERMADRRPRQRLTMVLSPTLAAMLQEEYFRRRFDEHLRELDALCVRLERVFAKDGRRRELVAYHRRGFRRARSRFFGHWRGRLVEALDDLRRLGCLELMTTALTHAYLPCLEHLPGAAEVQVEGGLAFHQHVFGARPDGFWLPECGVTPSLARLLERRGVGHSVLEAHGLLLARPRPPYGVFAPIRYGRLAMFGREPQSSRQVWSRVDGFPSHPAYREYFCDAAYESPADRLGPFLLPNGQPRPTGIKFYRVSGKDSDKDLYRPAQARATARRHAERFVRDRAAHLERIGALMDHPIVVAPYDAELFGHWWYEGPLFLREVIRLSRRQHVYRLDGLSSHLRRHPSQAACRPATSSWGEGGYHRVWLSPENDWMVPALGRAWAGLRRSLSGRRRTGGLEARALRQALCEMVLAQASDWPFMIFWNSSGDYARRRFLDHLQGAEQLLREADAGQINEGFLAEREARSGFLPAALADRLLLLLKKTAP